MKKEMLINVLQPEESRIAIVEDGVLEELYVERTSAENLVGNIYKGRVVNIEPSIQAVFVDFGVGRNGFLHVSDVEYQYYKHLVPEDEGPMRSNPRFNERSARNKPRFRTSSSAAAKCSCRSSRKASAPKGPPSRPTSASPAATWS